VEKNNPTLKVLDAIAQAIFDKKGSNILALDLQGISTMTDYVLIAEGNVDRHLRALTNEVVDAMEQKGYRPLHIEGMRDSDWIIIDFGDIVVHLFTQELREKYAIEELWRAGKIVDLHIITISNDRPTPYYA
jgi:ribosome-associated protein